MTRVLFQESETHDRKVVDGTHQINARSAHKAEQKNRERKLDEFFMIPIVHASLSLSVVR